MLTEVQNFTPGPNGVEHLLHTLVDAAEDATALQVKIVKRSGIMHTNFRMHTHFYIANRDPTLDFESRAAG